MSSTLNTTANATAATQPPALEFFSEALPLLLASVVLALLHVPICVAAYRVSAGK